MKTSMNISVNNRAELLQEIGPGIARQMTEVLQKLTAEKIEVKFGAVQTLEENKVLVDIGEKCFGSFVNFSCPETELEGVAVLFFPLSSIEVLTKLLLKRYLGKLGGGEADSKIKLSAFKEATNILLTGYISAIANTLEMKFRTSVPKFVRFRNFEFLRPGLVQGCSRPDRSACIGQFGITGPGGGSVIKGLFISAF